MSGGKVTGAFAAALWALSLAGWSVADDRPPNVVLIFIDDLGYADVGCFRDRSLPDPGYGTPRIDRLACQGRRFTDFLVSSAVCSASRAGLLTGCYHRRVGIDGALGPRAPIGLHADEVTLAEICRSRGYATACFGKWHLGCRPPCLPLQHGFDEYYGLPYSNDMWPRHPDYVHLAPEAAARKQGYPPLPLWDGNTIVDADVSGEDQARLTSKYTCRAVDFIRRNRQRPFFLYLAHTMVHVPLFVSPRFDGATPRGLFGDVMAEVDGSVGRVLDELTACGLECDTLVIFTSDNGPWLSYGDHAGSAGRLREGKGTAFEGGFRVPAIVRWPGRIPAGTTCDELASTIDLLPTIADLIGAERPPHPIDGKNIWDLMRGAAGAVSPHEAFLMYYENGQLQAIRDRRWKLHFPHGYRSLDGKPGGRGGVPADYQARTIESSLFDLKRDVGETTDVAASHPEVVQRLQESAERGRQELGDTLTGVTGSAARPAARLPEEPAGE